MNPTLDELTAELERAWVYTDELWSDLTQAEVEWRSDENSSSIGWHLGHQAAVAHFMVRNLLAAEPSPDPALDSMMDSATPERGRGDIPPIGRLRDYRENVAMRLSARIGDIESGAVGAPQQLRVVACGLLTAVVNHEYQHDQWIGEVRSDKLGKQLPSRPESELLTRIDGYTILTRS